MQALASTARHSGARRALECGRRRCADARVLARQPRGHRAHVPRRSAASHPRRRHARPADPRQDQQGRLVFAYRRVAVAVRQCRGVGSARHRPYRRFEERGHARDGAGVAVAQGRRAIDPQRCQSRDAPPRPAIRHGAHDRRGSRQRAGARVARLHVFVRHAGRGGDDRRRRRALLRRPTSTRSTRSAVRPAAVAPSTGRASPSNCRRCIRATRAHSANAC